MIKEMMVNKKIIVDDALECLLMPSDPAHDSLYASMQYSLMAGGKRIRPCLFLVLLHSFMTIYRAWIMMTIGGESWPTIKDMG